MGDLFTVHDQHYSGLVFSLLVYFYQWVTL